MLEGPKLLLLDGNNTCHKIFWAMKRSKQNLSYKGRAVEVVYGFFRHLISLHKEYPDYFRIVTWDGGYARRLEESTKAVEAGVIPSAYKATRHTDDNEEDRERVHEQMDELRNSLNLVRCLQVAVDGVEADDIINTYVQTYRKWGSKFVIVSSDKDFYQLLGKDVVIRRSEDDIWTEERFRLETGISPEAWLEAGALMGEKCDNILGVEGWGPVTALKYAKEYGDIDSIIKAVEAKEKKSKKEQVLLESIPRLRLAKSLKAMDVIQGLPKPRVCRDVNAAALEKYFLEWGFASLLKEIWRLV
jgi:DNA polymerase-1